MGRFAPSQEGMSTLVGGSIPCPSGAQIALGHGTPLTPRHSAFRYPLAERLETQQRRNKHGNHGLHQAVVRAVQRDVPGPGRKGHRLRSTRPVGRPGCARARQVARPPAGTGRRHRRRSLVRFPAGQDQGTGRATRRVKPSVNIPPHHPRAHASPDTSVEACSHLQQRPQVLL